MPRQRANPFLRPAGRHRRTAVLVGFALALAGGTTWAGASDPTPIRTRTIEIEYSVAGTAGPVEVELWTTRDRAATWQKYGVDPDRRSPFSFTAPAEGLFGLTLVIRTAASKATAPKPHEPPQQWVFIDTTPPLIQWQGVEPGDDFRTARTVHLRWTAYDDHFDSRPIGLAYQSSVDQQWHPIAEQLNNAGRYDWKVPAGVCGQITLKLSARDRGGHVVERLYGPVPFALWSKSIDTRPREIKSVTQTTTTAPADTLVSASRPAPDAEALQKAEERYRLGSWHLLRGQYGQAAERFQEALELNPDMPQVLNDLAGTYYLRADYGQAVQLYNKALSLDPESQHALRGAVLAYVAQRDYAKSRDTLERLLEIDNKDAEALLDLGDVLLLMGRKPEARQKWSRAASVDTSAREIIRKAKQRLEKFPTPKTTTTATTVASGQH